MKDNDVMAVTTELELPDGEGNDDGDIEMEDGWDGIDIVIDNLLSVFYTFFTTLLSFNLGVLKTCGRGGVSAGQGGG